MQDDDRKRIDQSLMLNKRSVVMSALSKKSFKTKIKMLEIGVWCASGSTNIWLDNFMPGSDIVLVDSWRPYSSSADVMVDEFGSANWDYAKMDSLMSEAYLTAYLNVRKFENDRNDKNVSLIRGKSLSILPLMADSSFDFIYIDGDHKYESVKADILNAKRLINKDYGIICGDDLEKMPDPQLIELARKHKERDYIKGDYCYHPGVCLAVFEEFEQVNMVDGFWWVVCQNKEFTVDALTLDDLHDV